MNNPQTHIDTVSPDEMELVLSRSMERAMGDIVALLEDKRTVDEDLIKTTVGKIVTRLPEQFLKEVPNRPAFEAAISSKLWGFVNRFKEKEPSPEDVSTLVADLSITFMEHGLVSAINNRSLDAGAALPADVLNNPNLNTRYKSIVTQKALGLLVWTVSTITSYMGTTNYAGSLVVEPAQKLLAIQLPAAAQVLLRNGIALISSLGISQLVQKYKEAIEDKAHKVGHGAIRSVLEATKDRGGKRVASFGVALGATLLLSEATVAIYDVGTNVNGIATGALQRDEVQGQIKGAQSTIASRVEEIRTHMDKVRDIPEQVGGKVETRLELEASGQSETGSAGKGPIWHAKSLAFTEAGPSDTYLETHAGLGTNLDKAVHDAGVLDNKSLEQELGDKVESQLSAVEEQLTQIEAQAAALDPNKEVEFIQADLDKLVDELTSVITTLNGDVPKALERHLKKYDMLTQKLVDIAKASGQYPDLKPDKLERWTLDDLTIGNSKIEIESMHYVGFKELLPLLQERYQGAKLGMILAMLILAGLFSSYGDLLTLPYTAGAYATDRALIERKRRFLNHFEAKVVELIVKSLNAGPFSQYLKPGTQIDTTVVQQALKTYLAENSRPITENSSFKKVDFILPARPVLDLATPGRAGRTDIAIEHNAEVAALQKLMSSPAEIHKLLERILPGIELLANPRPGESVNNVRVANNQHIDSENARIAEEARQRLVAAEAARIRADIAICEKMGNEATLEAWEESAAALAAIFTTLSNTNVQRENDDAENALTHLAERKRADLNDRLMTLINRDLPTYEPKASSSDEDLNKWDSASNRYQNLLEGMVISGRDVDQMNAREAALDKVEAMIKDIAKARREKLMGGQADRDMAAIARESREQRRAFERISNWHDAAQGKSGTEAAKLLATAIGYEGVMDATGRMAPQLRTDIQTTLKAWDETLKKQFDQEKNPDSKEHVEMIGSMLLEAEEVLNEALDRRQGII